MKRHSIQSPLGHPAMWSTLAATLRQRVAAQGDPPLVVDGVENTMHAVFLKCFPQGDAATISGRSELEVQRALVAQQGEVIAELFNSASAIVLVYLRNLHDVALRSDPAVSTPVPAADALPDRPRTWWRHGS